MLLLEHDDIAALLSPEDVIEALRKALLEQSKGLVQVPPRSTVELIVRFWVAAHYASDSQWLQGDGF